jgi:uncharacterized protein (DUF58 family)
MQQPYVRTFNEERDLTAWFLLDLSPSLDFGSGELAKRQVAAEFVAVLARLFTRRGNRVGAMFYGDAVDTVIPARSGRLHVLQLLHRMLEREAPDRSSPTDLAEFIGSAGAIMKRRSLVFVVSDFVSRPGWGAALARLNRRHEVIAVRLFDPMETELPDLGLVVIQDAESGEQLLVDTHDRWFRARFAAAAARRERAVRQDLAQAQVDAIELATDDDLADTIFRFADLRKRRVQLNAGGGLPRHLEENREVPVA